MFFFLSERILNQCIKLFHISGEVIGLLCELDCSGGQPAQRGTDWDPGFGVPFDPFEPSLLVLSALVLEENKQTVIVLLRQFRITYWNHQMPKQKKSIETAKTQRFSEQGSRCATHSREYHFDVNTLVLVNLPVLHTNRLYDNVHVL